VDGRFIVFSVDGATTRRDLWEISLVDVTPDRKVMAVDVKTAEMFENSIPACSSSRGSKASAGHQYDVTPDGQRFLINADLADASSAPTTLVLNWTAGVKR